MKFIKPQNVVAQMGLKVGQIVADFGSGSGFFALGAAKMVGNTGKVYAVDVQQAKLTSTFSAASQQGFKNIQIIQANLDEPLQDIDEASCDAVIMASVLHEVEKPRSALAKRLQSFKTGGLLLAVEWKADHTIFGPPLEKRIPEIELEQQLAKIGLHKVKSIPPDNYHYAVVFSK